MAEKPSDDKFNANEAQDDDGESLLPVTDDLEPRELTSSFVEPYKKSLFEINLERGLRGWNGKCPERKYQLPSDEEILKLEFKSVDELERWLEEHGIPRSVINPTYLEDGGLREETRDSIYVILRNGEHTELVDGYHERRNFWDPPSKPCKLSKEGINALRSLISEIDESEATHTKLVEEQSQLIAQYEERKNIPKAPKVYPDLQSYGQQLAAWGIPIQLIANSHDGHFYIRDPYLEVKYYLGARITQRPLDQRIEMTEADIDSLVEFLKSAVVGLSSLSIIDRPPLDSWGFTPPMDMPRGGLGGIK